MPQDQSQGRKEINADSDLLTVSDPRNKQTLYEDCTLLLLNLIIFCEGGNKILNCLASN